MSYALKICDMCIFSGLLCLFLTSFMLQSPQNYHDGHCILVNGEIKHCKGNSFYKDVFSNEITFGIKKGTTRDSQNNKRKQES